jgi:hypothetical protein
MEIHGQGFETFGAGDERSFGTGDAGKVTADEQNRSARAGTVQNQDRQ